MKTNITLIAAILFTLNVFAQNHDTLFVSTNKTVVLIFDSEVLTDDVGSKDVIAAREGEIIKLKAKTVNFKETSLFVKTSSGYHSFILNYKENPKVLSVYINNTKNPIVSNTTTKKETENLKPNEATKKETIPVKNEFSSDCENLEKRKNTINDMAIISKKALFQLADIVIKNDKLYFKVLIKNNSNIDYDIELIRFSIRNKKGDIKQAAVQETILTPVYIYNDEIKEIKGKERLCKVFVFDKFTYDNDKKLLLEIWENGGERILDFTIKTNLILDVKPF